MFDLLALSWKHYAFSIPLSLLSVFLILVVLVQRGRGGGLTGALGGMGGQSAFGTKAGDLFTRITIAVAAVWILLCMLTLKVLNNPTPVTFVPPAKVTATDMSKSGEPGATKTADGKLAPATGAPEAGKTAPPADAKTGDAKPGESKTGGATTPAPAATTPAPTSPAPTAPAPAAPPAADDAKQTNP